MTNVRDQIHCFVPKNDAVVIVIENDCDSTTFQCRCAQERLHTHHVKCDLNQNSSSRVHKNISVHSFAMPRYSLPLPRHVKNSPWEIAVRTKVDKRVRYIQNRPSTRVPLSGNQTDFPSSPSVDVSCCLPARRSRVLHPHIQSCSLETLTIESRVLYCRFPVAFARVASFFLSCHPSCPCRISIESSCVFPAQVVLKMRLLFQ